MGQDKQGNQNVQSLQEQTQELLDELESARRRYGLQEQAPTQAQKRRAAAPKEEIIMADQDQHRENSRGGEMPPTPEQPVYYDADGNPVTPVVYYDAQGRPVIPVFSLAAAQQPQEQYETLPDGTRVRVVYQEPESKRTGGSITRSPAPPQGQAEPAKPAAEAQPHADRPAPEQSASMRVIYEAPDAPAQAPPPHRSPAAPAQAAQPAEEPAREEQPPASSGLAELFAEAGQDAPAPAAKQKQKKAKGRFGDGWLPWRGDTAAEKVRRTVFLLALLTLIVCVPFLLYRLYDGWYNQRLIRDLADQVQTDLDESAWEAIRAEHPDISFPEGMNPAYADLYAANQEMVGWLKIENTKYINFPIVQAEDNEKYLDIDFYGRETDYGNPFLDFRNNVKELDRNTIVYGHHMRSGDQEFSELTDYLTIEGFQKSPVIEFNTLYADYKWKVYAVFLTNSEAQHDNGYIFNYIFTNLSSDEKFMEYIDEIDQRKLYTTGVDIQPTDKILTLSTCNYDWSEQRLVVVARLVREGESEAVDTSLAVKNENPRYPQIYYDQKGISNPYRDAGQWKP